MWDGNFAVSTLARAWNVFLIIFFIMLIFVDSVRSDAPKACRNFDLSEAIESGACIALMASNTASFPFR